MECKKCEAKIAEIKEQLILQFKLIRFGLIFESALLGLVLGLIVGRTLS